MAFGALKMPFTSMWIILKETVFVAFDEVDGSVVAPAFLFFVPQKNVAINSQE